MRSYIHYTDSRSMRVLLARSLFARVLNVQYTYIDIHVYRYKVYMASKSIYTARELRALDNTLDKCASRAQR